MKSLIIYFSHTGENYMEHGIENITKGNTEKLVETLQSLTNADIFKVEPVNKYPYDYNECCDIAKAELNKDARPALAGRCPLIPRYALGVWWGHYPRTMFSLLEKLDFTGKTVAYLTTHEGSGLGSTLSDVKRFCGNANIKEGLAIRGSKVDEAKQSLVNWLNK